MAEMRGDLFYLVCCVPLDADTGPVDMFYIIDTSRGVSGEDLKKMKKFVLEQGVIHKVSEKGARISVIAYADRAVTVLPLKSGTSVAALRSALSTVGLSGGQRRAESGLKLAKDTIVNKRDGVQDDRGKVVVLMVGGRSDPSGLASIKAEGDSLRLGGAKTVIMGVGPELDEAALKSGVVDADSFVRVKSGGSLLDATPAISRAAKEAGKISVAIDLAFILGATGKNAANDFRLGKQAVVERLKKLDVSRDKARVGLILYGKRGSIVMRLDSSVRTGESALSIVGQVRAPGEEGFALGEALNLARNYVFTEQYGARRNVPKAAVVFVNRDIDEASRLAADGLRQDGVKIIAVSLGTEDSRDSLKKITSGDGDITRIAKQDEVGALAEIKVGGLLPGKCLCLATLLDWSG